MNWTEKLARHLTLGSRGRHPGGLRLGSRSGQAPLPATYARILDGEHLWIAIANSPDDVCLEKADGRLIRPTNDLPEDAQNPAPGLRAYRWRLVDLLPPEEAQELALVVPTPKGHRPVSHPHPVRAARSTPPASTDAAVAYRLISPHGNLAIQAHAQPPTAYLADAWYAEGRAGIRCTSPENAGDDLVLVTKDRERVSTWPGRRTDNSLHVEVDVEACPLHAGALLITMEGHDGELVNVMRHRNRLVDPSAVMLPQVNAEEGTVATFRFQKNGQLSLAPAPRDNAGKAK